MSLTPAQKTTLKAAITANPTWAAFPLNGDGYFDLSVVLSAEAATPFWVWSTTADVGAIRAAITWANLTPNDVPDGTQTWMNRSLQCQGKQFNLQMIIPFTGTLDASDPNLRGGLQDALTSIRSGAGGAAQGAGWPAVQAVLARKARNVEQILADTTNGNGSSKSLAATMVYEGSINSADVMDARNS
jgi:hypothetical protein